MTIDATPVLTVAGITVGLSAASSADVLGIEALSVTWGRSSLLEQPTPARLSLALLDRSAARTFGSRTDLIGQVVTVGWSGTDGGAGTFFRGRITDADTAPVVRRDAAGMQRRMLRVSIGATSLELDAANYTVPPGTAWPAESLTARRDRIFALLPAGLFSSVTTDPGFTPGTCAAVTVSDRTVLDLLRQVFSSQARPMIYDPATNAITYATRRWWITPDTPVTVKLEALTERAGRYAATASPVAGVWLPASRLADPGAASRTLSSRISRVEVSYLVAGAQNTQSFAVYADPSEAVAGRRTLAVDSCLGDGGNPVTAANNLANEWGALAGLEGSRPTVGPLVWRSTGGWWETAAQRSLMLAGREQSAPVLVQGSWLPEVGMPPLVGMVGGVIGYAGGDWTIQLTPAGTFHSNPPAGLTGHTFAASTIRATDVDPSVSFGDCPHIQSL